ncbi:hypothetical protein MMC07_000888 [Pseudocyphellaria aurata]|nr:hypothetical protein [Pseudocyphellaria aurata]
MNVDEKDADFKFHADPEDAQLLEKSPQNQMHNRQDAEEARRSRIHSTVHVFVLYCLIAALIVIVLALFTRGCKDPSQGIYSPANLPAPAQGVIEYETRVFDENFQTKGPYMGRPDGLPDAGIPTNETDKLDEQYIVELDVFHQLRCLNAIRKTFFPDRYRDSFTDYWLKNSTLRRNYTSTDAKHYDHCIDALRQSIMCHGDIATVYWR